MRSPTQPSVDADDIAEIVRDGLGLGVSSPASSSPALSSPALSSPAVELSGGGFAAVWRATLTDGREVVIKVGPPPAARLLSYEAGLLPAEVEYYGLVRGRAPVPEVLASSFSLARDPEVRPSSDWIISTLLPGRPLTEGDSVLARRQLGAAIARVHEITGPHFGYTGDRPSAADWPTAFAAILDSLRADAAEWNVPLPPLDGLVARHHRLLATVTRPALLHFDLWDGNVLVAPDGSLSGLVDGERYLYGDPLLDFVSPALFQRITPAHPFAAGYGVTDFTPEEQTRIALYRVHLYVLMLAEQPSRGMPLTGGRHDHVTKLLEAELEEL
ncbi:phosphotransferase family protein [Paractinoplanes lichenicola]|uniref:Aminoglycoside phosphotransferase family protein n=1 Tax=Paractinoplanes lichenicola TaxID=2802976 RepID=A0ABS1VIW8_9ACTN|nr:aminoglycoside phosphotransferase family protein [Actinoplanes lichenicola]MBL7254084.1 aminoglycoside phosphotransferase family protein [Actinoplanes lichenicola]